MDFIFSPITDRLVVESTLLKSILQLQKQMENKLKFWLFGIKWMGGKD
jgi:hypothetical protein